MHEDQKPPAEKILHTYGDQFSVNAPKAVLPYVFSLVHPKTVIDVGCGIGTWAFVARQHGCEVKGLDGPHVPAEKLLISPQEFIEADLANFKSIGRFDLAICLEVAEHIPESRADNLVANLCQSADVILFSAAIPLQGGQNHINEQWPTYWQEKFRGHDFIMLDILREHFWQNPEVEWWYRQNMFLVCRADKPLTAQKKEFNGNCFIHPEIFTANAQRLAKRSGGLRRIWSSISGRA